MYIHMHRARTVLLKHVRSIGSVQVQMLVTSETRVNHNWSIDFVGRSFRIP